MGKVGIREGVEEKLQTTILGKSQLVQLESPGTGHPVKSPMLQEWAVSKSPAGHSHWLEQCWGSVTLA